MERGGHFRKKVDHGLYAMPAACLFAHNTDELPIYMYTSTIKDTIASLKTILSTVNPVRLVGY